MLNETRFAIIITSDRASSGEYEDKTTPLLRRKIEELRGSVIACKVIPDEMDLIVQTLLDLSESRTVDVVLTSGGTGITPRDVTVDATMQVIDRELPGFGEEMRRRSLEKTPYAILSRATAGTIGKTLIINLPGSPKGAVECLEFITKPLKHGVELLRGEELH